MKKILSIILCLAMILSLAVMASAASTPAVEDGEYVIYLANQNLALSSEVVASYYLGANTVTVSNGKVSDYTTANVWTVKNNSDGTVSISHDGDYLAMGDSFSSIPLNETNRKWILEDAGNGLFYIKNADRGNYLTYYSKNSDFSTGTSVNPDYADYYIFALYNVKGDNVPDEIPVPENGSTLTIAEALEYAGKTGDNVYTITGTITSIEGEEYGNMYIKDNTGSIYVYGVYSEDGSLKFNELDTKPVVGDTITVSAKLGVYNNVPQLKSAWLQKIVSGGTTGGDDTTTGGDKEDNKDDNKDEKPTTKPTEPAKPVEYHGTKLSKLSDGDTVLIYSVANSSVMTAKEYSYTSSSGNTKIELEQLEVSVKNNVVTYGKGAIVLTVHIDGDKVSFTTPDGKYLYADGTDVKFVAEASEYTDFILEETEDGYFIKCATATYTNRDGETFAQYLEIYSGYFTCYSKYEDSNTSLYTFQFFEADPDTSSKTGDSISVIAALLLVSAAGIAIIGKKKEF